MHYLNNKLSPTKVVKLHNYHLPKDKSVLRSFVAFTSWTEDFIPDFARRVRPLNYTLKKNVMLNGYVKERKAHFQYALHCLNNHSKIYYPDVRYELFLCTDYSTTVIAAVLAQYIRGMIRPIRRASRSSKGENNYSVTEEEVLAIV